MPSALPTFSCRRHTQVALSTIRPLIAIVDDEESIRRALGRLVRAAGLEARTFCCGGEFLDAVKDHAFDCVVLDVHMPQVSGFDVQESLTLVGSNIPVVVITGRDSEETHARVMAGGAVAYLRKPVDETALLSALNAAVITGRGERAK